MAKRRLPSNLQHLQHFNKLLDRGYRLGWFGIDTPSIPCLGIAVQMAQKLHACTDQYDGEGRENDRVRDLADLWLLESLLSDGGLAKVRAAAIDTFERRAKHACMADNAGDHGRWRKDYPKIAPEVPGAPSTVDEAAQYVLELIARMDQTS